MAIVTDVTIGPELDGAPSLFSVAFDLHAVGLSMHEHLATGTAAAYTYTGPPAPDGRWDVAPVERQEFTTRLVVHRPTDPARGNGTVVVEWLNVTGGLDVPAVWLPTHRHLARTGSTWVGVTAQQVGVEGGGLMPGLGLRDTDRERYAPLHHPGDAFSFEVFAQVASALRTTLAEQHGISVQRLLAAGASQSAMHLTTYVNALDPLHEVFDGFLLQGRAGAAAPVGGWDPHELSRQLQATSPDDVLARRARLAGEDRIRADARVPVMVVQSETDVLGSLAYLPARQDDTERFRLWEVAGAAHCDTYFLFAAAHDDGSLRPEDLASRIAHVDAPEMGASLPINSGPQMHYVLQRAVDALDRWVAAGEAPPAAARLEVDERGAPVADDVGIVRGGVRTPWVDAPVAVLSGLGQPGAMAELFGTTRPLDAATLTRRYPGGAAQHAEEFDAATRAAVDAGFLLVEDEPEIEALGRLLWPDGA